MGKERVLELNNIGVSCVSQRHPDHALFVYMYTSSDGYCEGKDEDDDDDDDGGGGGDDDDDHDDDDDDGDDDDDN